LTIIPLEISLCTLDTEPWDEALDRRIWALSEERFMWDKTITERRRKAPLEIQNLMEDLMVRQQLAEFEVPEIENDAMEVDSGQSLFYL
jgi:hypothetical protein